MRSLIDIQIGTPKKGDWYIEVPIGMHVSDDDTDDTTVPELAWTCFSMMIAHRTIQKGKDTLIQYADELLAENFRFTYSGAGYHKLHQTVVDYLTTTDLSPLAGDWFEDPKSETRH